MSMVVLGIDYNNPDHTFAAHADLFASADIISAPPAQLGKLPVHISALKELLPLKLPVRPFLVSLGDRVKSGKQVLLLADGDPLYYGFGSTLADMRPDWPLQIVPSVSCLQKACAKMGLPWANLASFSLHGREDLAALYPILASGQDFCLLCGIGAGPDFVARFLMDRGNQSYEVHSFHKLGTSEERIESLNLESCASTHFPLNSMAIFRRLPLKKQARSPVCLGKYSTPELIRCSVIQLLRLKDKAVIWDIGAGSGMMGCALAAQGRNAIVFAVEELSSRLLDIQYNRKLLDCHNLEIIRGHAPGILETLPQPDAIFVGGGLSSDDAGALLDSCSRKLAPGGVIVASCILLDSLHKCLNHSWSDDFALDYLQMQISRSEPLGRGTRLVPANPLFLFRARKKEDI